MTGLLTTWRDSISDYVAGIAINYLHERLDIPSLLELPSKDALYFIILERATEIEFIFTQNSADLNLPSTFNGDLDGMPNNLYESMFEHGISPGRFYALFAFLTLLAKMGRNIDEIVAAFKNIFRTRMCDWFILNMQHML
jgi:hypothetical protein